MHHFTWSRESGRSGAEVEYLLRQYGIRSTRRQMADARYLGLSVPDKQANWAEYILLSAGVPLLTEDVDRRNQNYATRRGGTMPAPWGRPVRSGDFVGWIVDWVDGLFGELYRRKAQRFIRSRRGRR